MAFCIPHSLLTLEQKNRINKDLVVKEEGNFMSWKNPYYTPKELSFFMVDVETQDVYLPMYYASKLFKQPLINRRRKFQKTPVFYMKTELYDYQKEVVDISLSNFDQKGTTFLNVFCSYGKTVVAAYFASLFSQKLGLITLVTYPRIFIGKSWLGTFKNLTTAKVFHVGEDTEWSDDINVVLCMNTKLAGLSSYIRKKIGHFIVDEAHMYCTQSQVGSLLSIEPIYITLLTATYERDDGFHKMLDLMVGNERITRISKKPFFVIHKKTEFKPTGKEGKFGVLYGAMIKDLEWMQERNHMILRGIMDNLSEKMLVLTLHVDYAKTLASWISTYVNPYGLKVAVLAGNTKKYDDANIIVATKSKVSVGFDEKEACIEWRGIRINMLWLTFSTKKIEQIAGRVFRAEYPIIVDIEDKHKNLHSHWLLREKWYISRNGIIYDTNNRFIWKDEQAKAVKDYMENIPKDFSMVESGSESTTNTSIVTKKIDTRTSILKYMKLLK